MAQYDTSGHLSHKIFNEDLLNLFKILQNINYNGTTEPSAEYAGALWRDNNDLKYAYNNKWNSLFSDKFKITSNLTSPTAPANPVVGQLWIDSGTLKYFDGTQFVITKAEATDQEYDGFSFYNFLHIHDLLPSGEGYANNTKSAAHYSVTINADEWIYNSDTQMYSFSILQSEYKLKNNFIFSLTSELYDGIGSYIISELDDSDYQFAITTDGTITIYIKEAIKCTLMLNGTMEDGVSDNERVYNYLVPNAATDKVFINGLESQLPTFVNDVTLSMDVSDAINNKLSLIHVNESYLSGIIQNIIIVNASSPLVNIKEESDSSYSEYYIYDINDDTLKLLNKHSDLPEYTTIPTGIALTGTTLNKYTTDYQRETFVLVVTYSFKSYKSKGSVTKTTNTIFNAEDGIPLNSSNISDNTILFVDSDYIGDYTIDTVNNNKYLYINDYTGKHFISLINVDSKTTITSVEANRVGEILIPRSYLSDLRVPLIYVDSLLLPLDDLVYDLADDAYIAFIDTNTIDSYDILDINNLYVSNGIVGEDNNIPCSFDAIPDKTDYIVIINNHLYNKDYLVRNTNDGTIYGSTIKTGDYYIVLKNPTDFVLRESISSSQVYTDRFDDAVVYVNGSLSPNEDKINFSNYQYNNQLIKYDDSYYIYITENDGGRGFFSNTYLIDKINALINDYKISEDSITFVDNSLIGKQYTMYAYTYGNSVEHPLIAGEAYRDEHNARLSRLLPGHQYSPYTNSLSVYIGGVKQPYESFAELSPNSFELYDYPDDNILYVIEPLENDESKSCEFTLLTKHDMIPGYANTFTSNIILNNGFVKVYRNGLRLTASEFSVKNAVTLYINEVSEDDEFLVEVRQDYLLRELTVPINYDQTTWVCGNSDGSYNSIPQDNIPESLVTSKDLIMIYINGLALGTRECYVLNDGNNKYIKLVDEIKELLDSDVQDNGYITFEWR